MRCEMKRIFQTLLLCFLICAILPTTVACGGGASDERANPCPQCESGELTEEVKTPATEYEDGEKRIFCSKCEYEAIEKISATRAVKILIIGDITASDSVFNLYEMLHGVGLTNSVVANASCAYNTGASIDLHLQNVKNDKKAYNVSITKNSTTKYEFSKSFSEIIAMESWDYVALGQSLVLSGDANSYSELGELLQLVREATGESSKMLLHMPWALGNGSGVAGFENYGSSSEEMSDAIRSVTKEIMEKHSLLDGVIPVGTAISNAAGTDMLPELRGSKLGLSTLGKWVASSIWCSYLTGKSVREFSPNGDIIDSISLDILFDAAENALDNEYEVQLPMIKSIKILIFGNSYGNDANKFLTKIFLNAGYRNVVIGVLAQGGCNINNHVTYLDDDPTNDFKGGFGYTKTVNGVVQTVEHSYDSAIREEDWDIITIQHAPGEVELIETYSELEFLLGYIEERVTNPNVRYVYHMIWKYYADTLDNYDKIVEITRERVLKTGKFSGVISSLELICQLRENGITYDQLHRDYAHLSMGLGRFALGLMWYCYLTGESPESITYRPSPEDVEADLNHGEHKYVPVTDGDFAIICDAIRNAIEKPYGELTDEGQGGAFNPDRFFAKGE